MSDYRNSLFSDHRGLPDYRGFWGKIGCLLQLLIVVGSLSLVVVAFLVGMFVESYNKCAPCEGANQAVNGGTVPQGIANTHSNAQPSSNARVKQKEVGR